MHKYFMRTKRQFSFVNISSIYGVISPKFEMYEHTSMTTPIEYVAVKSVLIHLSKYVVSYVNDSRFRMNCISPGGAFDNQPSLFLDAYKAQTNGAGMLKRHDVVGAVLFFLSDQSQFIIGQNIVVEDGFTL